MRSRLAFAAGLGALGSLGATACGNRAVLLEVSASDLSVPGDLDSFCLAIGDRNTAGGEFAQRYAIGAGDVDGLPQSLAVEPGDAASGFAWVRGYQGGIEKARDSAPVTFGGGVVALTLARCPGGPSGAPALIGDAALPAGSRLALSIGRSGSALVAVGEGEAVAFATGGGRLDPVDDAVPAVGGAGAVDLIGFDADGDCDEDLLLVLVDAPPVLWHRQPDGRFREMEAALPSAPISRAAAAADVDGDGDIDLVLGGAEELSVWLNDGEGRFTREPTPIEGDAVTDVVRLGLGDLDGDGTVDLVVGRGSAEAAPSRVLFGGGTGGFEVAPGALPEVPHKLRALLVEDMNGDRFPDVVMAGEEMPVRLYLNRTDGRLEDRSFVSLPGVEPIDVVSLAAGDWDGDCFTDLVIGLAAGGQPLSWRGGEGGRLVADGAPAVAGVSVLLGDADDDGDLDLFALEPGGQLGWAAR